MIASTGALSYACAFGEFTSFVRSGFEPGCLGLNVALPLASLGDLICGGLSDVSHEMKLIRTGLYWASPEDQNQWEMDIP